MKFVVAFSSPKRSAMTVERAAAHAKAMNAEVVLLRIVPDPEKVGVTAVCPLDKPRKVEGRRRGVAVFPVAVLALHGDLRYVFWLCSYSYSPHSTEGLVRHCCVLGLSLLRFLNLMSNSLPGVLPLF